MLDDVVELAVLVWKQSLWWGPGDGGPMMFSDNAAPINMFRVNRVAPLKLPSILGWLGLCGRSSSSANYRGRIRAYSFFWILRSIGSSALSAAFHQWPKNQLLSRRATLNLAYSARPFMAGGLSTNVPYFLPQSRFY